VVPLVREAVRILNDREDGAAGPWCSPALDSILVSLNGDFADIVSYPPARYRGIVALQVRNHPEVIPSLVQRLLSYLSNFPDTAVLHGKSLLVEAHRIRLRGNLA
jgi:hypothetical protein